VGFLLKSRFALGASPLRRASLFSFRPRPDRKPHVHSPLDCHVCRTPLPPEDLSASHGIAFCRRCQTLIRLDRYQPPRYQSPMVTTGLRPQVELPKGWSIQWTAEELCIVYRWFSGYLQLLRFSRFFACFGSALQCAVRRPHPGNPGFS
jgi:hypothetical protein